MVRLPALLLAVCLASAPAAAQNQVYIPPDAANEQDPAGTALVDAFTRFCLANFPGKARMEDAAPGQVVAMPPGRVREYLHDDPGRGWVYRAGGGEYVVTVEDPPYHTCAVRRAYAAPPRYRLPWLLTTGTWAAGEGRTFQDGPAQTVRRDGMVIEVRSRILPGPGGGDVFMELNTTYADGHMEERLARRAMGR